MVNKTEIPLKFGISTAGQTSDIFNSGNIQEQRIIVVSGILLCKIEGVLSFQLRSGYLYSRNLDSFVQHEVGTYMYVYIFH